MPVDPYDARAWENLPAGGTAATVERGPRRWEAALAYDRGTLSDHDDRLGALEGARPDTGRPTQGPSSQRGEPTDGFQYYDTDLNRPLWGDGSVFRDAAGTAVATSSGGGATAGPSNFTAVVNSDNTISLAWTLPTPPSGQTVTAVTVREKLVSPGGVSGMPLAGTATSNTRPASSSTATREYYVTCTFSGGTESAESNHITVYLPYGATPTGGGGGTTGGGSASSPAALLGLGPLPKVGGRYNLGVGRPSGHVDIPVATVEGGYVESGFFELNSAGTGVRFRQVANGGRTSTSTAYQRTEGREYGQDGTTKAAWNASTGTHAFEYEVSVGEIWLNKPWMTVGQIHDASSDAMAIKWKGTDRTSLDVVACFYDTDHPTKLATGYNATQGESATHLTIKVEISSGGTCKIYVNGVLKITSTAMSGKGSGHYWKFGSYGQSSSTAGGKEATNAHAEATYYSHKTTHSPTI